MNSPNEQAVTSQPAANETSQEVFVFPLSFAQQRLWLLDRLLPRGSVYNVGKAHRLVGALDVAALRAALNELLQRHEVLRTRFGLEDRGPVQVIAPQMHLALEVEDLGALAPAERTPEARRLVQEEAQTPFDLEQGPLIRARLLRLSETEHWLLISLHHIVTDGWSSGVLARELSALYGSHSRGEASTLPALPVQYADYAVWQREWLQGEVLEQQLGYWKPVLADLPALELPTDRPRPAVASFRGGQLLFEIDAELTAKLRSLSRREGATLFMTLLASFQVLLSRHSGQDDVAVGVPIAGRVRPELNGLIGFFVNSMVLRGDLSGEPTFTEYLARVRTRSLEAYAHQDLPFEKLVEELHPKRDLSRNPLFQVALVLQNTPPGQLQLAGLTVEPMAAVGGESAKFDLHASVTEVAGALRGRMEYASDLFDEERILRMIGHWRVLLEGIVADPGQAIGRLPLLTAQEREQLLVTWNATAAEYPRESCIHALFEAQVERTPQASALAMGEESLSYRELNARANQLAHHLRTLGVGPEIRVGLCVERSVAFVVGMLGILKAGGAYVPLDPEYPAKRLAFMLADTQAPVLVTQQSLVDALPVVAHTLCIDRDWSRVARGPETNPEANANAGNLAYVIYTSGSTGEPKGVMIEHRSVNRLVCNTDYLQLGTADRVAQASNVTFDAATFEVWGALLNGGCLVILPRETILDERLLAAALTRHRITTMFVTTALFNALARAPSRPFAGLANLLFGGEASDAAAVHALLEHGRPKRLLHVYGPTETTTFATWLEVSAVDPASGQIPIGRPIGNTRAYVLDAHGQPQPIGIPGELHIGGDGVARGYLARPELTAWRFVPDTFDVGPGRNLYKTGDIARWRPDGNLEFLGRSDHQVKIRGFRIELGEVEATLAQHPSVANAMVVIRKDPPGDPRLVAYIVARDARLPTPRQLYEFVKDRLPAYMVPAAYVTLDQLPLGATGKLDRMRLPEPGPESMVTGDVYVAPRDELERQVCRIWSEILGVKRVGLDDNFFDLGGQSLLGARLVAQLSEDFGRSLPLATLFESPTVRKIAEIVRSAAPLEGCASLIPITRASGRTPIFAVPGVGGHVICYADLARALGPNQPFYGLQSMGLDGISEPLETIEAMAKLYVSDARTVQPNGPYIFIGSCFGATVAYEMARQVLERGEEIAFLGLLDPTSIGGEDAGQPTSTAPRVVKRARAAGGFVRERLKLYRRELTELGIGERLGYLGSKFRTFLRRVTGRGSLEGVRLEMTMMNVHRANVAALRRYDRQPLAGRVHRTVIFETQRRANVRDGVDWGNSYPKGTVRRQVAGKDAGDMLNGRNALGLAKAMAEQLGEAGERK